MKYIVHNPDGTSVERHTTRERLEAECSHLTEPDSPFPELRVTYDEDGIEQMLVFARGELMLSGTRSRVEADLLP